MQSEAQRELDAFLARVSKRNPHHKVFHQAVREVAEDVMPFIVENAEYRRAMLLDRLAEPDRMQTMRVTWVDDSGDIQVNRAWRIQMSNAIGPYKGGLRFHPDVSTDVFKFLAFEQVFKNSLTGLPMGGAKGGSDFDPKGKSDNEVMRFCQAFMTELHRHIGEDEDVPAGDIGVGAREIGYLFGQYLRLSDRYAGVLTGKGMSFGGSAVRTEATGYGCVYFLAHMLARKDDGVEGKTAVVSGSGNVALYAMEKLDEMGARPITASDSGGFIHDPDGITGDKLRWLMELKLEKRGRVSEYAEHFDGASYHEDERPWGVECDLALPCATQNELDGTDARTLVDNGVKAVAEGANMPTTAAAVEVFRESQVLHAPGKASNAGGVAVSGLEQSQNALRLSWSRKEVDDRLRGIMSDIHERCVEFGGVNGHVDYVKGANLAGFQRVAQALLAYGAV